jgi:rifampicin phosphotransferase
LQAVIAEATANTQPDDPASVERASAAVRRLFRSGAAPEPVATAIHAAYTSLGAAEPTAVEPAVAVRSSATAQDLPGLSFAGQYDSYLNVRGEPGRADHLRSRPGPRSSSGVRGGAVR